MSDQAGTLFIIATPIGNLEDLSARARRLLGEVDLLLCEDTRSTGQLLAQIGVRAERLQSLHEHNERARIDAVLAGLAKGQQIGLVSDAGTPLISDPGYPLVRAVTAAGARVVPVPGASALTAALSVAGLPTDRVTFCGFLPPKTGARCKALSALGARTETLVFYESPKRIEGALADIEATLGDRECALARELTKRFETVRHARVSELREQLAADSNARRGEFVIVLAGADEAPAEVTLSADELMRALVGELAPSRASKLVAKLTGANRRDLYDRFGGVGD